MNLLIWIVVALAVAAARPAAAQQAPAANSCLVCHGADADTRIAAPAKLFSGADIHRESGFACVNCHGGDPAAEDKARAHDVAKRFKGKPAGQAIVETCAGCHSDAAEMRKFAPRQ